MKKVLFLLVCLGTLLLSGCLKADFGVKVNEDGSIDTSLLMAIEKEAYALLKGTGEDPLLEFQAELREQDGFTVEEYDEDEYFGFVASRSFDNPDELNDHSGTTSNFFEVDVIEGTFKNQYIVKGFFEAEEEVVSSEQEMFMSQFELTFTLELPGRIGENNATRVEDNKLIWELAPGGEVEIEAESSLSNTSLLLWISLFVVFAGALSTFIVLRNSKNKNNAGE